MPFNSLIFIFLFLPLLVLFFKIFKNKKLIIIIFSLTFYIYSSPLHLFLLISSISWVFIFLKILKRNNYFKILICSIYPLFLLFFFKYYNFIIISFFNLSKTQEFLLPIGISFFTFQLISYVMDIYDKKTSLLNFKDLLIYISFFPQIIAGPIVRINQVKNSIKRLDLYSFKPSQLRNALILFLLGLSLKLIIADNLSNLNTPLINNYSELNLSNLLFLTYSYSLQIYFDFFGYSICAIALGKIFGFNLPQNFRNPYVSINPVEFWRRWHITLSQWLKDYIYIRLGGNKKYARNIIIVFIICGIWHGAGGNFIIWGLYHAMLIIIYKYLKNKIIFPNIKFIKYFITFSLISVGWLLFIFEIDELIKIFLYNDFFKNITFFDIKFIIPIFLYFSILNINIRKVYFVLVKNYKNYLIILLLSLIFIFNVLTIADTNQFIYFRF